MPQNPMHSTGSDAGSFAFKSAAGGVGAFSQAFSLSAAQDAQSAAQEAAVTSGFPAPSANPTIAYVGTALVTESGERYGEQGSFFPDAPAPYIDSPLDPALSQGGDDSGLGLLAPLGAAVAYLESMNAAQAVTEAMSRDALVDAAGAAGFWLTVGDIIALGQAGAAIYEARTTPDTSDPCALYYYGTQVCSYIPEGQPGAGPRAPRLGPWP